jgi:hypothetical protein
MRITFGHGIGVKGGVMSPPQSQMMDRDHFVVIQPDIKVSEIVGEDVINGAKAKL